MKADSRLDSWKAIAAYLGRTARTVQRWEREEGLPVHRDSRSSSSVFAFADEIEAWSRTRLPKEDGIGGHNVLIGRQAESDWLDSLFDTSINQGARFACVVGEPGIGKTMLVDNAVREWRGRAGTTILTASCSERVGGIDPYLAFCSALRRAAIADPDVRALLTKRAPDWAQAVLEWRATNPAVKESAAEPGQGNLRLQLTAFIDGLCDRGPSVIWFDDLHLTDRESLDLAVDLITDLNQRPLLVVGCYRDSDMSRRGERWPALLQELRSKGQYAQLDLGPLGRDAVSDYVEQAFPANRFPPWFADSIYRITEGLALFLTGLLEHLRRSLLVKHGPDGWRLDATTATELTSHLPDSMQAMIDRAHARMTDSERDLLTAASVQGARFDSAVLARVTNTRISVVEGAVDAIARVHRLVNDAEHGEFRQDIANRSYAFAHGLHQRALAAAIEESRRAELSGKVAEALEYCYGSSSNEHGAEIATLWESAGNGLSAGRWFLRAVERAERLLAHEGVPELADRGMKCLGQNQGLDAPYIRARLEVAKAIHSLYKSWPEVGATAVPDASISTTVPDTAGLRFQVLSGRFWQSWTTFDLSAVKEILEEMQSIALSADDPAMLAETEINANLTDMDLHVSIACISRALELLEAHGDAPRSIGRYSLLTEACAQASWSFVLDGSVSRALETFSHGFQVAAADANPLSRLYEVGYGALFLWLIGDYDRCLQYATKTLERSRETGMLPFVSWGLSLTGAALCGLGKVQEGVRTAERAASAPEPTVLHVLYLTLLAESCALAGDVNRGLTACEEAAAIMENKPWLLCYSSLHRSRAQLLHKAGRREDALRSLEIATEAARTQHAPLLELRAAMAALEMAGEGDRQQAVERLRATLVPFESEPTVPIVEAARNQLRAEGC